MTKDSVLPVKSKAFAIKIIKLYTELQNEKKEFVLSKQILRSGTSIGANIREAIRGQSKADFYAKLYISLKEAEETEYWLELLCDTDFICHEKFDRIANVIGAQSIKRDLYLSIQAIETGVLSTLVLNMIDEVNSKIIDLQTMSKMLNNVTIIPTQANRNKNTDLAVQSILKDKVVGENLITYSQTIEKWIDKLVKILPKRKVYAVIELPVNYYSFEIGERIVIKNEG